MRPDAMMAKALELALQGRGKTSPNPLVGCVLVRDGEIIAEGWHDHLGGLHAEQEAIAAAEKAGISTKGATAYVTLEPCNHHGRTPPCTESLLWAGIKRVIISQRDPNPMVCGGGLERLVGEGIEVVEGVMSNLSSRLMQGFLHWCRHRRPLVTAKMAVDSQGSVDDLNQESSRFTSHQSLELSHQLRAVSDSILVGIGTVLRDDPMLTVRLCPRNRHTPPLRVILDPHGKMLINSRVNSIDAPTLQFVSDSSERFEHVECSDLGPLLDDGGLWNPEVICNALGDREIHELLIEGGPKTIRHFLDADFVDRFIHIKSPVTHVEPLFGFDIDRYIDRWPHQETRHMGGDEVSFFSREVLPWKEWPRIQ